MRWKRIVGCTVGILFSLILTTAIAGYFILRSQGFHRYVLAKIVEQGEQATGGRVEVQNFDFKFSTLTATLYSFSIHGTEPKNQKPLLTVDKLTVRLKILSVLHRHINLREIIIEHPSLHLLVNKNGISNIPQPTAPKEKSSQTNVFDLAVGHALLTNGEIEYNDRKVPLNADVSDLRTEISFSFLTSAYTGSLGYHLGKIDYPGLPPLAHSLDLSFNATPSTLTLSSLGLKVGGSQISLQGNVTNYAQPKVSGNYNVLIHSQDIAGIMKQVSPVGDINLSGQIDYQSMPGQAFLRDVVLNGELYSELLKIESPQGVLNLRKLRSHYQMASGNFHAGNIAVNLLNGALSANLKMDHVDADPSAVLSASLHGISLKALSTALQRSTRHEVPLAGTVEANTLASWTGDFQNLKARSDLAIHSATTKSVSTGEYVPVNANIHVSYDGPRDLITVRQSTLSTPATLVTASGQISDRSDVVIQVRSSDLRELATIESLLSGSQAPNISGSFAMNATVKGPIHSPSLAAQVSAQNLQFEGVGWRSASFSGQATRSEISIQSGALVGASQGQVSFSGSVGLRDWSYVATAPIILSASIKQIPITDLQHLGHLNYPVDGSLFADLSFRGTQLDPAGHGSLQLVKGRIADEPIQSLAIQFKAANGSIDSSLKFSVAAGSGTGDLTYVPRSKSYKFQVDAPAIILSRLQTIQAKNIPLIGTLKVSATGKGTLEDPDLTAKLEIPQLQVRENSITAVKATLAVADHHAKILLNSDVAQATIRANADINLTGDYYTDATIDTTKIPLDPLLAIYVPNRPVGFEGSTEFHATLKGPLKNYSALEAHIVIPTLTASYQSLQIANVNPIRLDYANSVINIPNAEIKGTDTALQFQGRIPLTGSAQMSITANGSVDMRLLTILSPDIKSSGTIALNVKTEGTQSHPIVGGQVTLKQVSLYAAAAPVGLTHANGVLDIGSQGLTIRQLTGQVGGGQVSASGTILVQPQIQFNVAMQANSVRLLYPDGLRTVLDSNLLLTGNAKDANLSGRVLLESLSFTPDFDLGEFMSQFTGAAVPPTGQNFADNLKLSVTVQSAEELSAASSQVSLQGQANLRVIGTASNPVIVGRTDLTAGDVFFLNNRYEIQRGIITFNNPYQTEPTVSLSVTTTIQQYNLTLNVSGPIDKLQTSYVSDPPLSSTDIINLIARGQTTEQADTTNLGADSLLAQGVAGRLSSGVQKLAGLSSLSIDPLLGGNNTNPSARIALQQRVSKNFFFTFSTDVTQPQSEIVQGEYQLNKRWSVSINRDASGGVAVDGKFHTKF